MANDINNLAIAGHLTRDVEMKDINGTALARFSIAVNKKTEKGEEVSFFDIQLWGKYAQALEKYLVKSQQVFVSGSLQQQRWEQDGNTRSRILINAEKVQLVGGSQEKKPVSPSLQNSGNNGYQNKSQAPQSSYQGQQNNYQAPPQGQFNGNGFQDGSNGFDPPGNTRGQYAAGPEAFTDDIPF